MSFGYRIFETSAFHSIFMQIFEAGKFKSNSISSRLQQTGNLINWSKLSLSLIVPLNSNTSFKLWHEIVSCLNPPRWRDKPRWPPWGWMCGSVGLSLAFRHTDEKLVDNQGDKELLLLLLYPLLLMLITSFDWHAQSGLIWWYAINCQSPLQRKPSTTTEITRH